MIVYTCPNCHSRLRVDEKFLGKAIRCPKCNEVGTVAADTAPAAVPVVAPVASPAPALEMPVIATDTRRKPRIEPVVVAPSPVAVAPVVNMPEVAPAVVSKSTSPSHAAHAAPRRRGSKRPLVLLGIGGAILLAGAGLGVYLLNSDGGSDPAPALTLEPIARQEVTENSPFKTSAKLKHAVEGRKPIFSLDRAPTGATIDAATGKIAWTPGEKDGPKEHTFVVRAASGSAWATQTFVVNVAENNQLPRLPALRELSVEPGQAAELRIVADDPDIPKATLRYSLKDAPEGAAIDEKSGQFRWVPDATAAGRTFSITVVATKDGAGLSASVPLAVRVMSAETTVVASAEPVPMTPVPEPTPAPIPAPAPEAKPAKSEVDELVALYEEPLPKNKTLRKLFAPASYKTLRHWFSQKFERKQEPNLRKAWGTKYDEMRAWLDSNVDLKEELFTALQPDQDDVSAAMQILAQLKAEFPKDVVRYGNLTIATCVVWDKTSGVYGYQGHAQRAKANMPAELADAVSNFRYLVEREKVMEGRILYVPWEYLTLVVNHPTPLQERDWALANYGARRVMFGKCYQDCPYDTLMLKSSSAQARLNGKEYNFVTLKEFGGVCAHQADYSSRIGKSIGVPAAYVSGEGRFAGAGHAWVMWVELISATPGGIKFSLESFGRYNDDHYYVGHLPDPQTGQRITDRDLERRLHAVGANTQGRRHAELVMRAWPLITNERELEFPAQLAYLSQTLGLSQWNEQAWRQLAGATRGAELSAADRKEVQKAFMTLFTTFAHLPDLTVEVFGDLLAFETKPKKQIDYYVQLLEMYAAAKRPDLSFQALPQLIQLLSAEKRQSDAVAALAAAIKKNANEGQYVPAALDRLDALCLGDDKLQASLLAFYSEFVPLISTNRGGEVSDYCVKMHQRAIQKLEAGGQTAPAQAFRARLQGVQAAGKQAG